MAGEASGEAVNVGKGVTVGTGSVGPSPVFPGNTPLVLVGVTVFSGGGEPVGS